MPFIDPLPLELDSEKIHQLAQCLPEPADYFTGKGAPTGSLPGEILCFARMRASHLNKMEHAQSPEQHHRCVLIVAVRGSGRLRLDADTFVIKEGEAQIICPFQYHSYTGVQPEDICWVYITFELASPASLTPLRSKPSTPMGPTEMLLLREILQCWAGNAAPDLLTLHVALLIQRLCAAPKQPTKRQPEADLVARINGWALPRLNELFRLNELAKSLGESESNLRARFRQLTGKSLGLHLRQMRLRRACELLLTTEQSITEVAEQCGYDSVFTFSRAFKTNCGVSPRAYRKGNLQA